MYASPCDAAHAPLPTSASERACERVHVHAFGTCGVVRACRRLDDGRRDPGRLGARRADAADARARPPRQAGERPRGATRG
eukprot:6175134-Pleurochrysis_carterae.AAC.1